MKYCLITPQSTRSRQNPGWLMITAGIKYLIKQADKNAEFDEVDLYKWPQTKDFERSKIDRFVICGNPRYDQGRAGEWLWEGILKKIRRYGIPVIDAWQGSASELGLEFIEAFDILKASEKNQNIIKLFKHALPHSKIITRDKLAQKLNESAGLNSVLMPCSSFWAAKEYGIEPEKNKTEKIVVIYNMPGYSDVIGILRTLSRTHRIIATTIQDMSWADDINLKHELINDPVDLLKLYAKCEEVISYRLHALIPAASLGASVFYCAIDSRFYTCEPFKIPYDDYRTGIVKTKRIDFNSIPIPDLTEVLK